MSQLALPLQLADHAVFASFLGTGNETVVAALRSLANGAREPGCWIGGPAAAGKTHLLQAVCACATDRSVYVPLCLHAQASPALLEGLESRDLVCLDDVDAVAGEPDWEAALFGLCNQILDSGGALIVTAATPPRAVAFKLPDLQSRLSRLPVFQLQALGEAERVQALQLRARHRGLELPDDTAAYLLKRTRRDMASLYALLDRLDDEALRAQRRLTIPFVREVLQET